MTATSGIVITIIEKIALANFNIFRNLKIFAHKHVKALCRRKRDDLFDRGALKLKV